MLHYNYKSKLSFILAAAFVGTFYLSTASAVPPNCDKIDLKAAMGIGAVIDWGLRIPNGSANLCGYQPTPDPHASGFQHVTGTVFLGATQELYVPADNTANFQLVLHFSGDEYMKNVIYDQSQLMNATTISCKGDLITGPECTLE